jgi:hypothetical protein
MDEHTRGKGNGISCKGGRVVIKKVGSQHLSAHRHPYCGVLHICSPHFLKGRDFFKLNKIIPFVMYQSYSAPKYRDRTGSNLDSFSAVTEFKT